MWLSAAAAAHGNARRGRHKRLEPRAAYVVQVPYTKAPAPDQKK